MGAHSMAGRIRGLRILLPATGLLLAAGAYAWWWQGVADAVEARIPRIAARGADAGIAVDPGTVQVGGFPYRVELVLTGAAAAARNWRWEPEEIRIYVQPWNLRHLVVRAGTVHRAGRPPAVLPLTADVLRASLVQDRKGALRRISVEATGLAAAHWSLDRIELHGRRRPDGFETAGRLEGLRWVGGAGPPDVESALLEGLFVPPPDLSVLSDPTGFARDGGRLEVSRFAFAWGPLKGDLQGTATLDAAGRPLGAFTMRTDSVPAALRFLEARGWAAPAATRAAEMALAGDDHEPAAVALPVTLQDGAVTVAGVPLMRVPAVVAPHALDGWRPPGSR